MDKINIDGYIKEKIKSDIYRIIYKLNDQLSIEIRSNSEKGLMKGYFSRKSVVESAEMNHCIVYIYIEESLNDIDNNIKSICKNQSLRSKRIANGYYNLHHFGEQAFYYDGGKEKYLIGNNSSCKKIFWSYIVKWILTEEMSDCVHLKATMIQVNDKGFLIIGGKSSGKSTFVYNLIKKYKDIAFITNTHVVINENLCAKGLWSTINFRKNIAQEIYNNYERLKGQIAVGCTNIDPEDMDYHFEREAKVDKVIFYQYNTDKKCIIEKKSVEEMCLLMNTFAYAINAYALRDDLIYASSNNINKIAEKLLFDERIKLKVCEKCDNYVVTCDSQDERCIEMIWRDLIC